MLLDSLLIASVMISMVFDNKWQYYDMEHLNGTSIKTDRTFIYDQELGFKWFFNPGNVYIKGNMKVYTYKDTRNAYSFYPMNSEFGAETGINIFRFKVFVRHMCSHPMSPYVNWILDKRLEGSFNTIGVLYKNY